MAKRTSRRPKNKSFLMMLAAAAFLFVALYILSNRNFSFNLNSSAGKNRYSATGTLVVSSQDSSCESAYSHGLISPSSKECTPLVISTQMAEPFLGKSVKVEGALKDGVFYVTTVRSLGESNDQDSGVLPSKPPSPGRSPLPLRTENPSDDPLDYPLPYPIKSTARPLSTPFVSPE